MLFIVVLRLIVAELVTDTLDWFSICVSFAIVSVAELSLFSESTMDALKLVLPVET